MTCKNNHRPRWTSSIITENDFREILEVMPIVKLEARTEMLSEDTSREYVVARSRDGTAIELPHCYRSVLEYKGYWSNPGLFDFNAVGKQCLEMVKQIDEWEQHHRAEREEYERLKRIFEQ